MPAILCENGGVEEDEIVQISKADDWNLMKSSVVSLQIVSQEDRFLLNDPSFSMYMKEVLIDLEYFISGQKVSASYFGTNRTFLVSQDLSGSEKNQNVIGREKNQNVIGRISRSTQIKILNSFSRKNQDQDTPKNQTKNQISYKSIGGLKDQIKSIKEMVELPLFRAEKFLNLGLRPPRGFLLHGPAGLVFCRTFLFIPRNG